jgi:hypothetical protein
MSTEPIETHLATMEQSNPSGYLLVRELRRLIKSTVENATERVMYGGLVYAVTEQFCGIFAYKDHVSIEFSHGVNLKDPHGVLEGSGKHRRHIKVFTHADVSAKGIEAFVRMAQA